MRPWISWIRARTRKDLRSTFACAVLIEKSHVPTTRRRRRLNDERENRTLHAAIQRAACAHGGRHRPPISNSVPTLWRRPCCLGNVERRRAAVGYAEIAPQNG